MTANELIVDTRQGRVQGSRHASGLRFAGIPYAESGQAVRFQRPGPPRAWAGIRAADTLPPAVPQPPSYAPFGEGMSEEGSLALNVFTPAGRQERRPVLVWVHGGGYTEGGSGTPEYDPSRLVAREGVVVVTINYRLGAFGFLSFGDDVDECFRDAGNLGLLDQRAALQWVADNIEAFGGDPDNITLFGESAGAMSIAALLGDSTVRSLVSGAILQSGAGSGSNEIHSMDRATQVTRALLRHLDIPADRRAPSALADVPGQALLDAQIHVSEMVERVRGMDLAFLPVLDGRFLRRLPLDAAADGSFRDLPLIIGTTAHEGRLFTRLAGVPATADVVHAEISRYFRTPDAVARFVRAVGDRPSAAELLEAWITDEFFVKPAVDLATAHSTAGGHVWMYRFDGPGAWQAVGHLGAAHGSEIPFVFDTLPGSAKRAERSLALEVGHAWSAFARSGVPALRGREWPEYTRPGRVTAVLTDAPHLLSDPEAQRRRLWRSAGAQPGRASSPDKRAIS